MPWKTPAARMRRNLGLGCPARVASRDDCRSRWLVESRRTFVSSFSTILGPTQGRKRWASPVAPSVGTLGGGRLHRARRQLPTRSFASPTEAVLQQNEGPLKLAPAQAAGGGTVAHLTWLKSPRRKAPRTRAHAPSIKAAVPCSPPPPPTVEAPALGEGLDGERRRRQRTGKGSLLFLAQATGSDSGFEVDPRKREV
jgi:hypothetical protein